MDMGGMSGMMSPMVYLSLKDQVLPGANLYVKGYNDDSLYYFCLRFVYWGILVIVVTNWIYMCWSDRKQLEDDRKEREDYN